MAKIRKAVFRSGIVMLSLLAAIVLSSSVAQAQRCEARKATGDNAVANVRAEGMTEMIGGIELRSVPSEDTGSLFAITDFTLSVTLNTPITSLDDLAYVEAVQLTSTGNTEGGAGIDDDVFLAADDGDGPMIDEDEDPNTVVWEELSGEALGLGTGGNGFNVIIAGIRANAYMVGDDGEISAQLTVNTKSVSPGAFDVSDVKTGLVVEVDDANVLQCRVGTTGMASISIMEGFVGALSNDAPYNMVEVNFSGIPDGVEFMITHAANNMTENAVDGMKVTLTGEGDEPAAGTMVEVALDNDGDGDITYTVTNANDMTQGNTLMVSFTWEEDTMIADGMVSVGFVSAATNENPQFADAAAERVIGFDPCETSLLFPFVTNAEYFDTGIAFTNASNYGGTCEIKFYGAEDNPADMETMEVPSWGSETYLLSAIAMGFQGFLDVNCDFENGQGFAYITNGFGKESGPTAAQGYLAIVKD